MKSISLFSLLALAIVLLGFTAKTTSISKSKKETNMELSNKEKAVALIESLETGAQEPIAYINPTLENQISYNASSAKNYRKDLKY